MFLIKTLDRKYCSRAPVGGLLVESNWTDISGSEHFLVDYALSRWGIDPLD